MQFRQSDSGSWHSWEPVRLLYMHVVLRHTYTNTENKLKYKKGTSSMKRQKLRTQNFLFGKNTFYWRKMQNKIICRRLENGLWLRAVNQEFQSWNDHHFFFLQLATEKWILFSLGTLQSWNLVKVTVSTVQRYLRSKCWKTSSTSTLLQ